MEVKWYGVNALEFRAPGVSFMIDPYVSRDRVHLHHPEEVDKYVASSPSAVLMTHAHWDHLADMPRIIARTGAILYGSATACNILRSLQVPAANLRAIHYGEHLELPGGVQVTVVESRHKGMPDEAPGYDAPPPPEALSLADNWRCGEVFGFLIRHNGLVIYNVGSANLLPSAVHGLECDYLIAGISRWEDGFPKLLQDNLRFGCLIPTHHDEFTLPLAQFRLRNDLQRLQAAMPGLRARELPVLQWATL